MFVNDSMKPLIVAHDPNPYNVKYASFKSNGPKIEFFYNCTNNIGIERKLYIDDKSLKSNYDLSVFLCFYVFIHFLSMYIIDR